MDLSDLSSAGSGSNPFGSGGSGTNPFGDPPAASPSVNLSLILNLNIHSQIPITLELQPPNYSQWHSFFHALIMSYNLKDHVDGTVDARTRLKDTEWTQVDWCIIRWLLGTVSGQIRGIVNHRNPTAYTLWTSIRQLFLSNRNQQGILALEEFHGLFQNDMSVTEYCTRLQTLADTLFDCAMPVTDRALVSNMLRGLSNKFAHAISTMTYDDSKLPTFLQARTYLLQEERRIDHAAANASATALYAGRAPPAPTQVQQPAPLPPPSYQPAGGHGASGGGGGGQRGRKRRKGGNGGGSGGHPAPSPPAPPAPAYVQRAPYPGTAGVNPWTGMFHAWPLTPRPSSAGVLGPRPAALGLTASGYQPPPPPAAAAAPTPWDTSALQAALLAMQQQPYTGGGDWILDTGASSHMAANPGPTHWDGGAPM
ncbi:hypothetical protein VPH35_105098 [Triticum aestivum]